MSTVISFHATGIKDEEDFTGFVVRQAELSNVNHHRGVMAMLDKVDHRPAFVHPSNVEAIVDLFPGVLPDWKNVVMNHTRYRLYSAFLPISKGKRLLEQYRSGTAHGATRYVSTTQIALRGRLCICLRCIASDYEVHGFAVWHRLHLMPSMLYCPTHEQPLMTFCHRCDISHRRAPKTWIPRETCLCGQSLRPVGAMKNCGSADAAIAIAKMAGDVLGGRVETSALADNTGPVLRARVRHLAQGLGRRDYHQVAQESIESRLGPELTSALGFTSHTFKRATGHRNVEGPLRNPIQNIAAIWSLFGGWRDFLGELVVRSVDPQRYDASTRSPAKRIRASRESRYERWHQKFAQLDAGELKIFRETCRATILHEKRKNVNFKRSDISGLPNGQKLTFFATHYDQQWLDGNLPRQERRPALPKVMARKQRRDLRTRKLVLQRYENTIRDSPQRLITRAFLLSETGNESAYKRGMGTPELESMLDQCIDTFDSWSKRQIGLVTSLAREVDKKSKWAAPETYEGLFGNAFSTRLRRAKAWIEKNKS